MYEYIEIPQATIYASCHTHILKEQIGCIKTLCAP
jgi:hypothetical protein